MGLATLLLVALIALLALIPTRRLYVAGRSERALATYFIGMVGLGLLVAELRGPARYLVPLLVVAYIAPFVTARAGIARIVGRRPRTVVRPGPIRRVGSPVDDAPASDASTEQQDEASTKRP